MWTRRMHAFRDERPGLSPSQLSQFAMSARAWLTLLTHTRSYSTHIAPTIVNFDLLLTVLVPRSSRAFPKMRADLGDAMDDTFSEVSPSGKMAGDFDTFLFLFFSSDRWTSLFESSFVVPMTALLQHWLNFLFNFFYKFYTKLFVCNLLMKKVCWRKKKFGNLKLHSSLFPFHQFGVSILMHSDEINECI